MVMTTMGSQYWPQTVEGRLLCVLLALYAFGVFGYVTAALATIFFGRDAENDEGELAGGNQFGGPPGRGDYPPRRDSRLVAATARVIVEPSSVSSALGRRHVGNVGTMDGL